MRCASTMLVGSVIRSFCAARETKGEERKVTWGLRRVAPLCEQLPHSSTQSPTLRCSRDSAPWAARTPGYSACCRARVGRQKCRSPPARWAACPPRTCEREGGDAQTVVRSDFRHTAACRRPEQGDKASSSLRTRACAVDACSRLLRPCTAQRPQGAAPRCNPSPPTHCCSDWRRILSSCVGLRSQKQATPAEEGEQCCSCKARATR